MRGRWRGDGVSFAVASVLVASLVPSPPTQGSQVLAEANKVVCFKVRPSGEGVPTYRTRPRQCIFVKRGEELFGYTSQTTKKLRWHRWDSGQARAKGKVLISTVGPRPVRIRLTRPRPGCDDARAFTKAHFRVPKVERSYSMRLDRCPR